jgi:flagellar motor switch protein FliM
VTTESNEPLLTGEETEALLEAMRSSASSAPDVLGADLASPDRPLRQALGRADRCVEELGRAMRSTMLRVARCSAAAEVEPAEILPFNVLQQAIAAGSAVALLRVNGSVGGLAVVGPSLAAFVIERRLGAPLERAEKSQPATVREQLSAFDRRVLEPLFGALAESFERAWTGGDGAVEVGEILSRSSEVPTLPSIEPMLRFGLRVRTAAATDDVFVALTSSAVRTTARREEAQAQPATPGDRERLALRIVAAEVELVAVLGKSTTTVRELLALSAGDIVRLDQVPGKPVDVAVEGVIKLRGLPVVHHGNLAIEIEEAC